jgi:hypothetical protein
MATVVVMVASAIISAVAFTGGQALYDKFGRTDNSGEIIRHNKAVEDLQKANNEWNQKRLGTLDYINKKLREQRESRDTFDDVDKALDFYNETHPDGLLKLPRKPALEDFYKPSDEHKYYEIAFVAISSSAIGYLCHKLI